MRANILGVPHRIVFQHKMEFDIVPTSRIKPGEIEVTMRKVPKPFKPDLTLWPRFKRQPQARAVTICAVLTPNSFTPNESCRRCNGDRGNAGGACCERCRGTGVEPPSWQVVTSAPAVCVWGDSFDKEFARQLALARVVETLPRAIGAPLVGAYMTSGARTLCDLTSASKKRYATLAEALPEKKKEHDKPVQKHLDPLATKAADEYFLGTRFPPTRIGDEPVLPALDTGKS